MSVYDIKEPLACLREGKADEAIPMLEQLKHITPGHVTSYVLLAQAYAAEARWQEAMITWQQAAFLMPNSPAIQKGLDHAMQMFAMVGPAPEQDGEEIVVADAPAQYEPAPEPNDTLLDIEEPLMAVEPEEEEEDIIAAFLAPDDDILPDHATFEVDVTEDFVIDEDATDEAEEEAGEEDLETEATAFFDEPAEPAEPAEPPPAANGAARAMPAEDEELDRLIADLESARIVPKPDYETIEAPDLGAPIDDMVSETLARIYEGQKQYDEAARMYDKLAILKPDRADDFTQKAVELRTRANSE
ncbi:MAG: tetratricopeptide repeat protein [Rhodothermales bacterium]